MLILPRLGPIIVAESGFPEEPQSRKVPLEVKLSYTVQAFRRRSSENSTYIRLEQPCFSSVEKSLADAKKKCLNFAKTNSGIFYQITSDGVELWFLARIDPYKFRKTKELVELGEIPVVYSAVASSEVTALKAKIQELEGQIARLSAASKEAQSVAQPQHHWESSYQQRVAAGHAQPCREESPSYSGQSGRSYDHRGYYREQRSAQGPYATYRPDGSEDTGFDR